MATLTIRDVPDELYKKLKERAERQRRSISKEAIVCLESALETSRVDPDALKARVRRLREQSPDLEVTDEELRRARDEGRA